VEQRLEAHGIAAMLDGHELPDLDARLVSRWRRKIGSWILFSRRVEERSVGRMKFWLGGSLFKKVNFLPLNTPVFQHSNTPGFS
jgi:hypothetical protein